MKTIYHKTHRLNISGLVVLGLVILAMALVSLSNMDDKSEATVCYKIVITNYTRCHVDGVEVDVKTFQEAVGLTGTDVDGTVGTKTIRATMLQNSIIDFKAEY